MINIDDWIKQRFPTDCNWLNGNCYFFANILMSGWPGGQIVYDPIIGHFMYLYNDHLYDWTGDKGLEIDYEDPLCDWDEYAEKETNHWKHIMRDCAGGYWSNVLEKEKN